jgi:hypothetical protein
MPPTPPPMPLPPRPLPGTVVLPRTPRTATMEQIDREFEIRM